MQIKSIDISKVETNTYNLHIEYIEILIFLINQKGSSIKVKKLRHLFLNKWI